MNKEEASQCLIQAHEKVRRFSIYDTFSYPDPDQVIDELEGLKNNLEKVKFSISPEKSISHEEIKNVREYIEAVKCFWKEAGHPSSKYHGGSLSSSTCGLLNAKLGAAEASLRVTLQCAERYAPN